MGDFRRCDGRYLVRMKLTDRLADGIEMLGARLEEKGHLLGGLDRPLPPVPTRDWRQDVRTGGKPVAHTSVSDPSRGLAVGAVHPDVDKMSHQISIPRYFATQTLSFS